MAGEHFLCVNQRQDCEEQFRLSEKDRVSHPEASARLSRRTVMRYFLSYFPLGGKVAQEGVNFGFAHIPQMLFSAEVFDITNDPIAVGILGAVCVMMITKHLADLIHKL